MNKKIILGTVQLGIQYGINNVTGKPNQQQAYQLLQQAQESGIEILDSAEAYGDSLSVIGSFMKSSNSRFQVISKFIGDSQCLEDKLNKMLEETSIKSLYAYLYHRFDDYLSGNYKQELLNLKKKGKIERIGVSLYSLDEIKKVNDDSSIDLIQVPLNIFDLEEQKKDLLEGAKNNGKEIHVRSVFLQGLFFKDPHTLTGNLVAMQQPLQHLRSIASKYHLSIRTLCLSFALTQPFVDKVIIGIDSKEQLIENLKSAQSEFPKDLIGEIEKIKIPDRSLLNPSQWKL